MRLAATAELVRIDGRTLEFRVEARDERERVGDGTHSRVIVNVARFDERVARKLRGEVPPR
jgi:predicted thioesterase